MRLDDIDLMDMGLFADRDPHQAYAVLRQQAPIYWHERTPGHGFWALTRYADLVAVYSDPHTFSSEGGVHLPVGNFAASFTRLGRMMITTDPPRHTKVRSVISRRFTPNAVAAHEPNIRRIASEIIDNVIENGQCDLVSDVAAVMPTSVLFDMLGVPRDWWGTLFRLTSEVIAFQDPEVQRGRADIETAAHGTQGLGRCVNALVEMRRQQPTDDLISAFTHAVVEGESLTAAELMLNLMLLIIAGHETTRHAISGGILALLEAPDQAHKLEDNATLPATAVEEIFRWTSPVAHVMRTVKHPIDFRGFPMEAGQKVALWNASANRDEAKFPAAEQFLLDRTPNDHLVFGSGEHYCVGAYLARLEVRIMIEEVLRRLRGLQLDGRPQMQHSNFMVGIKRMPVTFAAAPRPTNV